MVTRREALAGLAALLLSSLAPRRARFPKICIFNRVTGLPCPFCGLTRSFIAVGQGDLPAAQSEHYLGVPAYAVAWGLVIAALSRGVVRVQLARGALWAVSAAILGAWVIKLARHGY